MYSYILIFTCDLYHKFNYCLVTYIRMIREEHAHYMST